MAQDDPTEGEREALGWRFDDGDLAAKSDKLKCTSHIVKTRQGPLVQPHAWIERGYGHID